MTSALTIPAVWVYTTDESFNQPRWGGYASFLSAEQQARLERIRQARLLFDGRHRQYFLEERRTQFDFPATSLSSEGRASQMYLSYNVLGLISWKGADLLFGQEPLLRVQDRAQQQHLSRLIERSNLHTLFYSKAVDASYEGEAFLESCIDAGEVYLREVPSDEVFPIGQATAERQYPRYDRYRVHNAGSAETPIYLVLQISYLAGRIERRLFQLDADGRSRREINLAQWPLEAAAERNDEDPRQLAPVTLTGIARNTITYVPNQLARGAAASDYDGAIDLQDALNAKQTQIARVLAKHSDPKMAFPARMADSAGNVRTDHDATFYEDRTEIPQYIVWNAELQHAIEDRDFALNQLLVRTETSPVLLGLKKGAQVDAYKKVRLEAYNSLTKAARKASFWKEAIKRAVSVCQDLENTLPGVRYDRTPIGVELRDGIPVDDLDQAHRQSILRSAGLLSLHRALTEQLSDPAAVQAEQQELTNEAQFSAQQSAPNTQG